MKKIYCVCFVRICDWKSDNTLSRIFERIGEYKTREEAAKTIREIDIKEFWDKQCAQIMRTKFHSVFDGYELDFVANHDSEDPDYPWIETRAVLHYHYDDEPDRNMDTDFRYRISIVEIPSL